MVMATLASIASTYLLSKTKLSAKTKLLLGTLELTATLAIGSLFPNQTNSNNNLYLPNKPQSIRQSKTYSKLSIKVNYEKERKTSEVQYENDLRMKILLDAISRHVEMMPD